MAQFAYKNRLLRIAAGTLVLSIFTGSLKAQENNRSAASDESKSSPAPDLAVLVETVNALQSEIRALNTQLADLRSQQGRSDEQVRQLQEQLLRATGQMSSASISAMTPKKQVSYPSTQAQSDISATPMNSNAQVASAAEQSIPDRVSSLEEGQELLNSKVVEQSQTKVESASKYRVRFSGIVLLNLFANRGAVDNQDFPGFARSTAEPFGSNAFGASLRQSQFGVEVFGPTIAGARTSASVDFDFAGGFPEDTPNGQIMGVARLRTAVARFEWTNTSIVAGQDHLFFAPLEPTSLASLAVPPLSYAGNLWSWTPQVRVEHKIHLNDASSFLLQGGILDSLSGDLPSENQNAEPSWGEQSGAPAIAGRFAWTHTLLGQDLTLGTGAYFGRQYWGFGRHVNGWASTIDVSVPLSKMFSVTGAFYRGAGVGGLGGALDQDVVMSGSLFSPTVVIQGLNAMGGWMQLKFQPRQNFQVNFAYGQDNPFASQLDKFPNTFSYTGFLLTRNQSPFVNFIYQFRSNVEGSIEYRYLKTMVLNGKTQSASHVTGSLGYRF